MTKLEKVMAVIAALEAIVCGIFSVLCFVQAEKYKGRCLQAAMDSTDRLTRYYMWRTDSVVDSDKETA